jgi:Holliday junction resolvasome RuvABC endonuclease subunit
MKTILSIDPGLRNLAHCLATTDGTILSLGNNDIYEGAKISIDATFNAIMKWCDKHADLFAKADVIAIEKQFQDTKVTLSSCLLTVQTVLHCRASSYSKPTMIIHAMSVKRHFLTACKTHRLNKEAAKKAALSIFPSLMSHIAPGLKKIDDICDAFLINRYVSSSLCAT